MFTECIIICSQGEQPKDISVNNKAMFNKEVCVESQKNITQDSESCF